MYKARSIIIAICVLGMFDFSATAQRQMENLDRGVVAVRTSSTEAFISWRLLALDPAGIEFNLYRSANGGAWTLIHTTTSGEGCNYTDSSVNLAVDNTYRINPVIGGVEQASDGQWTLPANADIAPLFTIPLQPPAERRIQKAWVGDLDGDGDYEYVLCWTAETGVQSQMLQAYRNDGTLLWTMDFGLHSTDQDDPYNLGTACISAGQGDGVTVYDFDGDGRSEVIVKTANGVIFSDGTMLNYSDNITQFLSVLNGETGAELARTEFTHPWKTLIGRGLNPLFGVGYPDGERPSLMVHAKSRNPDGSFNTINSAWDYRDGVISNRWSIQWYGMSSPQAGHQIRCVDLDGDGKDELFPGVHAVDDDGTLLYNMGDWGVGHGDRWQVGDLDPSRPSLEMYAIQQDNASGLHEFLADAANGQLLWTISGAIGDLARGSVGDIDPNYPGMEVWAFDGLHAVDGTSVSQNNPYPNLMIWWNGDLLADSLYENTVDRWDYVAESNSRLLTCYHYNGDNWPVANSRSICAFQGDIIGDWREEMVFDSVQHTELIVFTTDHETTNRLYCLAQNPAYRNCLTTQGYRQQNLPDYYLGVGMNIPPTPNIVYSALEPIPSVPAAPSGLAATTVSDTRIDLAWTDNATNADGFKIERSTDGVNFSVVALIGAASASYSDTGLVVSTLYTYRVRAYNDGGESGYSNTDNATTQDPPSTMVLVQNAVGGLVDGSAVPVDGYTTSTFDVNGGNAVVLLVSADFNLDSSAVLTGVSFAGETMTLTASAAEGPNQAFVYYLLNPASSSGTFTFQANGNSSSEAFGVSALSLSGVNRVSDVDTANGTGSTFSLITTNGLDNGFVVVAADDNGNIDGRVVKYVSGVCSNELLRAYHGYSGVSHYCGYVPAAGSYINTYDQGYARTALAMVSFDALPILSTPPVIDVSYTNGMVLFSWPGSNLGWRLMQRTNLLEGVWEEVPGSGTNTSYVVDPTLLPADNNFYQLVYP